jgi:hypothetical protein
MTRRLLRSAMFAFGLVVGALTVHACAILTGG